MANLEHVETAYEILVDTLREQGYDGLYVPGECACRWDDFTPCGNIQPDCKPGYLLAHTNDDCGFEHATECAYAIGEREGVAISPDSREAGKTLCSESWVTGSGAAKVAGKDSDA